MTVNHAKNTQRAWILVLVSGLIVVALSAFRFVEIVQDGAGSLPGAILQAVVGLLVTTLSLWQLKVLGRKNQIAD